MAAAPPHEDLLHMLFAVRTSVGPWEQGVLSVPEFGVGIGDLPGEWVSRRVMHTEVRAPAQEVFAVPLHCTGNLAVSWQNSGSARHFLSEIA